LEGWKTTTTTVDWCTVTTTGINVWLRARSNGVDTRIADPFPLSSRCKKKKTMGGVSERREKKFGDGQQERNNHGFF
jgi:hypothetical protein